MGSAELLFGTSGWSYNEWIGPFYERKQGMFTQYTRYFRTAEVNSTFYRYPTTGMVRGWYRSSPPNFVFALKLPRLITHKKRLSLEEGVEEDLNRFLELVRPLAEKLGPILIQLRPNFTFEKDFEALRSFLGLLPKNYEFAVEFRHPSWLRRETWAALEEAGVAYAIVDEPLLPPEVHVTADFSYIRWHGRGRRPWYNYDYRREELEEWVPRVEEAMRGTRRLYGYFNNHFHGNAVKNCIEMLELLGLATPEQLEAKERLLSHRRGPPIREPGVQALEQFVEAEEEGLGVGDLLLRFMGPRRLTRAERIGDEEVEILRDSEDRIEARVRRYTVEVDLRGRVLRHNCADWVKGLAAKRMCKHVGKLFLVLPERRASAILRDIWEERERWRFEA
ncbi:DUF72 domain-containing protein [Candidatus Bathyarchaeota archaeon]|nr:DUF72 domain-containing protein [Candidatus Bathyarchaeota archaeon]